MKRSVICVVALMAVEISNGNPIVIHAPQELPQTSVLEAKFPDAENYGKRVAKAEAALREIDSEIVSKYEKEGRGTVALFLCIPVKGQIKILKYFVDANGSTDRIVPTSVFDGLDLVIGGWVDYIGGESYRRGQPVRLKGRKAVVLHATDVNAKSSIGYDFFGW